VAEKPVSMDDPYAVEEMPVNSGCKLRMVAGVLHVYHDEEALKNNNFIDWSRPDLNTFLADQALLFHLISDGPL